MGFFRNDILNMYEHPPPIYFSLSDPFIQEYYGYNYNELEFFLKFSLFLGRHVEFTAANLWQSKLTFSLFLSAQKLNDCGQIQLATRRTDNKYNIFTSYFNERYEESSHFIPLPGQLSYLDFQLPETIEIAKDLDTHAKANFRQGGNVTKIFSNNILDFCIEQKNLKLYESIIELKETDSVSRATIANIVLQQPLTSNTKKAIILKSNLLYLLSNAISTNAQLIYPVTKRDVFFFRPKSSFNAIQTILNNIGLTTNTLKSISFNTIFKAYDFGLLKRIQDYIWYFRKHNNKFENYLEKRLILYLARNAIKNLIEINNSTYKKQDIKISNKYIEHGFEINHKRIFHFNLNRAFLYQGKGEIMKNNEIKLATLIEELNNKLSLNKLKSISVELFEDYEFLPHSNKLEFIRELCLECKRQNKIAEVVQRAIKHNPNFNLLPSTVFTPTSFIDWQADNSIGENVSSKDQEKIISSKHRFQSISFLEQGFEISRRICMIVNDKMHFRATGFFIDKEYIMTNKHVLSNREVTSCTQVWLNYEEGTRRNSRDIILKYSLDSSSLLFSAEHDIAICKVNFTEYPAYLDNLPILVLGTPKIDDIVPIIQHPDGMPKQICIGHNSLQYINDNRIQYLTDTMPGSSGSPVFNSNWELIGLHSRGGWIAEPRTGNTYFRNEGIHIQIIKDFLKENHISYNDHW